ncbi:MAG TPA: YicC/YloC family endoribonuclease [Polyangiaceae bacterium]|nr:YicC/YloC family endoribonuclease [Polyangiaceae bacterium]
MTGFGLGEAPLATGKVAVEIRGVNHRFLDVRVRMGRELGDLAGFVEQLARERLARGRYEVAMRIDGVVIGAPTLDRDRARSAYRAFCELRDELAPGADVPLSLLASVPDLFVSSADRELERVRHAARVAFEAAAAALDAMRAYEGNALRNDVAKRVERVRHLAEGISQRGPDVLETHRRRLRERAERLRATMDFDVDGARLEQEIALFAERSDVCEELTRIESHCAQFVALLSVDEAVGRRLDFLLQEMAREANTIGAKSPDAPIAHAIVEVKAEIERMREQVQNVE